jgi:hypothetical protein
MKKINGIRQIQSNKTLKLDLEILFGAIGTILLIFSHINITNWVWSSFASNFLILE